MREGHGAIRREITKLQQAAYATACLELATETETPMPEIHELTKGFLESVGAHPTLPQTVFAFELKLLHELGMEPAVATSHLTPGAGRLATTLQTRDWPDIARLKFSASQNDEVGRWLHGFLMFHLGKLPRGRAAAIA